MTDPREPAKASPGLKTLRSTLSELYHGRTARALRFQTILLLFDVVLIVFFLISPFLAPSPFLLAVNYAVAAVLAIDLGIRAWSYGDFRKWLLRPVVIADFVVLISLLLPAYIINLAFLRILRAYTLIRSSLFWQIVGRGKWAGTNIEDTAKAVANLLIFIFVVTGVVHSTSAAHSPGINSYMDSLYFTISTLTTTGYGDITLGGPWGHLLSIFIMIAGISLFVRLAQVLLRPAKVVTPCSVCGLRRHEQDAVHCKACGNILHIDYDND